jgi:hypothetical protein
MHTALTLAAAAAATWGVLAGPAGIASADRGAQNTITYWEQQGYQVNIDRVGSGPLQSCVVTSVRNPNTQTQLVRVDGRASRPSFLVPVILSRTVQVSLFCANN